MRGLKDKVAIVTGGGGAIGRAICKRFAGYGTRVAIFDLDQSKSDAVVKEITAAGGKAQAYAVDIGKYDHVQRAVQAVESSLGPVDILVNNAGWDKFVNFIDTTPELWEKLIDINLRGPLNLHHCVLPGMVERGAGRVVNIASDAGRVGSSGEAVYSACKGGIIAFSKTMAREISRKGVTLNSVCPGPTDTPLLHSFTGEGASGEKIKNALISAIPMKRVGQPEDIPGIVCFLSSDDAGFITGQTISVSGGLSMAG